MALAGRACQGVSGGQGGGVGVVVVFFGMQRVMCLAPCASHAEGVVNQCASPEGGSGSQRSHAPVNQAGYCRHRGMYTNK